MTRVSKIENNSNNDVKVELVGGANVTLHPNTTLENADVANIKDLKGQVKVIENLTEVGISQGKTRING